MRRRREEKRGFAAAVGRWLGVHLILGLGVSAMLHEELGRSKLVATRRRVQRSPTLITASLCAGDGRRIGGGEVAAGGACGGCGKRACACVCAGGAVVVGKA